MSRWVEQGGGLGICVLVLRFCVGFSAAGGGWGIGVEPGSQRVGVHLHKMVCDVGGEALESVWCAPMEPS